MPTYDNVVEIRGRQAYRIEYVQLGPKGMIELYAPPLKDPALRLFPTQRGMLAAVGVDPARLSEDPLYVNFYAVYKPSAKVGRNGKPYKNVIALMPASAGEPDPVAGALEQILDEIRYIGDLLADRAASAARASPEFTIEKMKPGEIPRVLQGKPLPDTVSPENKPQAPRNTEPEQLKAHLIAHLGRRRYVDCLTAQQLQPRPGRPNDLDANWHAFAQAVRPRIVPDHVTEAQLRDACAHIDATWQPGQGWRPMIYALACYSSVVNNPNIDKSAALRRAVDLYRALTSTTPQ